MTITTVSASEFGEGDDSVFGPSGSLGIDGTGSTYETGAMRFAVPSDILLDAEILSATLTLYGLGSPDTDETAHVFGDASGDDPAIPIDGTEYVARTKTSASADSGNLNGQTETTPPIDVTSIILEIAAAIDGGYIVLYLTHPDYHGTSVTVTGAELTIESTPVDVGTPSQTGSSPELVAHASLSGMQGASPELTSETVVPYPFQSGSSPVLVAHASQFVSQSGDSPEPVAHAAAPSPFQTGSSLELTAETPAPSPFQSGSSPALTAHSVLSGQAGSSPLLESETTAPHPFQTGASPRVGMRTAFAQEFQRSHKFYVSMQSRSASLAVSRR